MVDSSVKYCVWINLQFWYKWKVCFKCYVTIGDLLGNSSNSVDDEWGDLLIDVSIITNAENPSFSVIFILEIIFGSLLKPLTIGRSELCIEFLIKTIDNPVKNKRTILISLRKSNSLAFKSSRFTCTGCRNQRDRAIQSLSSLNRGLMPKQDLLYLNKLINTIPM